MGEDAAVAGDWKTGIGANMAMVGKELRIGKSRKT